MDPRISVITLAVDDLKRSVAFYRDGLGFPTDENDSANPENGPEFFFAMDHHMILVLLSRLELAKDARIPASPPSASEICLGHIAASREEVDAIMDQVARAGGHVTDHARERNWGGYSGFFQDPDGHLWEIICSPQLEPDES
jgi:catechol 2,3-dioxygenase-like lactoylglutathione lyase family enzyme